MKALFKPTKALGLIFFLLFIQCKNVDKSDKSDDISETEINKSSETQEEMKIEQTEFGETADGEAVKKYIISNSSGLEMSVINYGGIITSLKVPDKNGKYENVVLYLDSIDQYEDADTYFGAIIGRYGNRIADGKFVLDGEEYSLDINDGPNSLHGGNKGFDKVIWEVEPIQEKDEASLKLTYISKDGESGYPGELKTVVTYTLNSDNELQINYEATTDKMTVINLTQHSYFNLTGDFSKEITDHIIQINALEFLPVDETLIPTGEIKPVKGTPFDFNEPEKITKGLAHEESDIQLQRGSGFDHCWVLNDQNEDVRLAASAFEPESGRYMEVYTSEPSLQFYIGNQLDGTLPVPGGGNYEKYAGFCMETQHYPDSPNQKDFPSVELKPGEKYTSETSYKFSVK